MSLLSEAALLNFRTSVVITIGTSHGVVLSAIISGGRERNVRPILTLGQNVPIIQILLYELPKCSLPPDTPTSNESSAPPLQTPRFQRLCIVVATTTQLFLFVGGPSIENALLSYSSGKQTPDPSSLADDASERVLSNLVFECPKESPFGELHSTPLQQARSEDEKKFNQKKVVLLWWLTGYASLNRMAILLVCFRVHFFHFSQGGSHCLMFNDE